MHDPKGKVRLALQPGVDGSAEFSPCGRYRYWLKREWGFRRFSDGREPYALWIGMNPSTAAADVDDPTIRREMGFTRKLGLDCYAKANVMDYRATFPRDLLCAGVEPCSPVNVEGIVSLAEGAACIVAAWGSLPKRLRIHSARVVAALQGKPLLCMGMTADGSPRHPLYLAGDIKPVPWLRTVE